MSIILVNGVKFDESKPYYYCSLGELVKVAPHVRKGGKLTTHVIEVRDERAKLAGKNFFYA